MDLGSISAAFTSIKYAIDALRTVLGTKASIEADGRVADVFNQLGKLQDAMFAMRSQMGDLQTENLSLKAQLAVGSNWDMDAAQYELIETKGGAMVYRSKQPPTRYACPNCFADRKTQFLQDLKVYSGDYRCPHCKVTYPVDARKKAKLQNPGGSGGWMGN